MIEHLPPSWTPEVREVLEAERQRRDPPREMAEELRRTLLQRLAVYQDAPATAATVSSPARRRFAFPWGSRGLRLVPKAAGGSFVGSLFAFAPLALAGLGSATLVGIGSYFAMRAGALPTFTLAWDQPPIAQSAASPSGFEAVGPAEPSASPVPAFSVATPWSSSPPHAPSSATAGSAANATARHAARRSPPAVPPALAPAPAVPAPSATPVVVPAIAVTNPALLALESRLLEEARQALRTGMSSTALRNLAEAEKVRSEAFAEEREALTVVALARSGDTREAARRMSIFTARYPQSIYLSRLHLEMPAHDDAAQ